MLFDNVPKAPEALIPLDGFHSVINLTSKMQDLPFYKPLKQVSISNTLLRWKQ